MPIIKSAIKRNRQNQVRRARNLKTISAYKKSIKEVKMTINEETVDNNAILLSRSYKAIDTAAKKRVISPQRAARQKAFITKLYKEAGGKMPETSSKGKSKDKTATKPKTKKATPVKAKTEEKTPAKKKKEGEK